MHNKAKLRAIGGRKATGFERTTLVLPTLDQDSRAAACDPVKVILRWVGFFYSEEAAT